MTHTDYRSIWIMGASNNMLGFAWRWAKLRIVHPIFWRNKFVNEDIGHIDRIGSIDKFVITIPKCGTTTIQKGFERLGQNVIHAHNNPTTYDAFPNGEMLRVAGINLESLCHFRRDANPDPMYFFFGYREPISWYLSLASHFSLPLDNELNKNIINNINNGRPWAGYSFKESQSVVETATGLQLLGGKFDHKNGFSVIRGGKISVILYRFDRLNELSQYIKMNIESRFELKSERVNKNNEYLAYCESFKLSRNTLGELYSNPVFSFFYSDDEAAQLIEKYAAD